MFSSLFFFSFIFCRIIVFGDKYINKDIQFLCAISFELVLKWRHFPLPNPRTTKTTIAKVCNKFIKFPEKCSQNQNLLSEQVFVLISSFSGAPLRNLFVQNNFSEFLWSQASVHGYRGRAMYSWSKYSRVCALHMQLLVRVVQWPFSIKSMPYLWLGFYRGIC